MIDEPVQNACGNSMNRNSTVDQMIHSSAQPLRCSAIIARLKANSSAKSRSLEMSKLFAATPPNPMPIARFRFAIDRQTGTGQAPRPPNHCRSTRLRQSLSRSRSRWNFLAVGQPIVGRQHRLGTLQVSVGRQDRLLVSLHIAKQMTLLKFGQQTYPDGQSRPGTTVLNRSISGHFDCEPCAACDPRRPDDRSAPARYACGYLPAPAGLETLHACSSPSISTQRLLDLTAFVRPSAGRPWPTSERGPASLGCHARKQTQVNANTLGEALHTLISRLMKDSASRRTRHVA